AETPGKPRDTGYPPERPRFRWALASPPLARRGDGLPAICYHSITFRTSASSPPSRRGLLSPLIRGVFGPHEAEKSHFRRAKQPDGQLGHPHAPVRVYPRLPQAVQPP